MLGAGRQWGEKRAPGIVHLRRPQQARDSAKERSRRPTGAGWQASGAADTVRCPPAHLSPRSRPVAWTPSRRRSAAFWGGAVGGDGARAATLQLSEVGEVVQDDVRAGRTRASRGGNRAHRGPPAAAEPPRLTDGAEERVPPLRATAGSFCKPGPPRRGGCPGLRLRPSASVGLQQPPRQALRRTRSGRRSQDRRKSASDPHRDLWAESKHVFY